MKMLRNVGAKAAAVILIGSFLGGLLGCTAGLTSDAPDVQTLPGKPTETAGATQARGTAEAEGPLPRAGQPREGSEIPYEHLAQGESTVAGVADPALFVAGSQAEAGRFAVWLDGETQRRLLEADFGSAWVVAFFRGRMGSSGYGVTIRALRFLHEGVRLEVNLTAPDPNRNVMTVESVPYLVVVVPRRGLALPNLVVWSAYDAEGNLLAETRHP